MFCKNCGKEITEDAKLCPFCGKETDMGAAAGPVTAPIGNFAKREVKSNRKVVFIIVACVAALFLVMFIVSKVKEFYYISLVKEGNFDDYPNVMIGEAFENYFNQPEWSCTDALEDGNLHSVEFEGTRRVDGVNRKVKISFVVNDNSENSYMTDAKIVGNPVGITAEDLVTEAIVGASY